MNEAIHCFKKLGLTQYESSALATVLSKHDAIADDIASIANIPRTKVYSVLNSLEKQGFLKTTLERPKKYRPVSPNSILSSLLTKRRQELNYLEKSSEDHLVALNNLYKHGERFMQESPVIYLPTYQAVSDCIQNFYITSKESILSAANEKIWNKILAGPESKKWIKPRLDFLERGGVAKILTSPIKFENIICDFSKNCFKLLNHPNLKMRFIPKLQSHPTIVISDEKKLEMSFLILKSQDISSGIIIEDKEAVRAYVDYFNMLWENSDPIPKESMELLKNESQKN